MKSSDPYILWLPSWYPNKWEPYNGDFIQRHAEATSKFCPITVIHFTQLGPSVSIEKREMHIVETNNLKQIIVTFAFKPLGITILDKVLYNIKYYIGAKQFTKEYFKQFGLPKMVHVHVPMKAGTIALWINKRYKIPFILSEQASHYLDVSPDSFFKKGLIHKKRVKKIFKNASLVTNVSHAIGEILKNIFQIKSITVIHNVVNTKFFCYQPHENVDFTYLHVSSLTEQKNIPGILNAFKQLHSIRNDWKLKIVGPIQPTLRLMIKEKGLEENIQLIGQKSYTTVAENMKIADAFILFSRHENFPCVIVESLCCGVPVIASDVAGIKEAVNETNGILVPYEDELALSNALVKIRNLFTKEERKKIAQLAMAKYNYNTIGNQIFNLYSDIQ